MFGLPPHGVIAGDPLLVRVPPNLRDVKFRAPFALRGSRDATVTLWRGVGLMYHSGGESVR